MLNQSYHGIVFGDGPTQYNITLKEIAVDPVRQRITERGGYLLMFGLPNPPRPGTQLVERVAKPDRPAPKVEEKVLRYKNSRYVQCIQTGKIYARIMDAADELNLSAGNISSNLRHRVEQVKGYTFRYATEEEYNNQ